MGSSPLIWSREGVTMRGVGDVQTFDPGVGHARYERALDALRDSGAETAFASFTFDPEEPGSVVLIPDAVERHEGAPSSPSSESRPRGRVSSTGVSEWEEGFEAARHRLTSGSVAKVVLARQVRVELDDAVSADVVLANLEGTHLFSIAGLIGASPELLLALNDGRLTSFPLAGTATSSEGLSDPRIELEHRMTADAVTLSLTPFTVTEPQASAEIVDLGPIKHLGTLIDGDAVPGTTVTDVLAELHPTPAVAGVPRQPSLELIREIEPFGRGRYAGPIGWMSSNGDGEFAVALRCGILDGSRATLFAGGGLVDGCDRDAELAETELKLGPMMSALGVDS